MFEFIPEMAKMFPDDGATACFTDLAYETTGIDTDTMIGVTKTILINNAFWSRLPYNKSVLKATRP